MIDDLSAVPAFRTLSKVPQVQPFSVELDHQKLRLKCLELASQNPNAGDVLVEAARMVSFVSGHDAAAELQAMMDRVMRAASWAVQYSIKTHHGGDVEEAKAFVQLAVRTEISSAFAGEDPADFSKVKTPCSWGEATDSFRL